MDRTQMRREVELMEQELPLMERWRDEATGAEYAERAAIVSQYADNNREARKLLDSTARERDRLALLQEHAPHPGATMGEVLERRGGRWVPKE
jgi:hypothetical protein